MRVLTVVLSVFALVFSVSTVASATQVRPLPQAHAHNDYEHTRPLYDALDHGFASVEADIYLVDGQLLVGHDPEDLRPERTLQSLYLEPLRKRVLANHGKVYRGGVEFQLLIDIKTNGVAAYTQLDKVLRQYPFLFTRYVNGFVLPGPVTAVISGDRPRALLESQRHRVAFYDGRIVDPADLGPGTDARLTPLVSDNWTKLFTWTGVGEFPGVERDRLKQIVSTAHKAKQRVRFWATPDVAGPAREAVWLELRKAGVDHINTDDLAGLQVFLTRR
ncbi:phosphatidylinositol-specific phospholipase C/glycerophosphodiester phosphodiesterase family protein [Kibdelosporangium philippinense]|uniref:Altered inheritance of mitochondria protein 6 n=1 Tax=Kibdelosporangium philippinense TaxID=211113 RepID=A0ABS8ZLL8_9PSEU|nr:phosphatidylinositol-specific phospholipase C/glycerophosphodiester phosphodiesterase family protein [Kibdelosporangium philippinense]MCE7006687.1 phosphatidylinositol-specific phospholipase C/glycerophosphodiester phosphodiesterase family protein [Kibdelosporangium philippinense]